MSTLSTLPLVFLLAAAVTAVQGQPVRFLEKKDIICKGTRIDKLGAALDACQVACESNAECGGYSWKRGNPSKPGNCRLYNSCDVNWYRQGWESAIKKIKPANDYIIYQDLECTGTHIESTGDPDSWEQCRDLCDAHDACHTFMFRGSGGRCYLMDDCDKRREASNIIVGIDTFHDKFNENIPEPACTDPPATCTATGRWRCPNYTEESYESTDLEPGTFTPVYDEILEGKGWSTINPDVQDYPTCPFKPPNSPYPKKWWKQCIKNLKRTGLKHDVYARPNIECPAGFFLCRGMCYTISQRNNRGPQAGWSSDFYSPEDMSVEARCRQCGGARVAFLGEETKFKKVVHEVAKHTINEDRATWVRRYRFLTEPSVISLAGDDPFQPWHAYVKMVHEDPVTMTYQRYYTGEKDDIEDELPHGSYDQRFRNQEASILCVNTIDRINAAVRTVNGQMTMENGCEGDDKDDKWDNDKHRWFPEHNWPFPGH